MSVLQFNGYYYSRFIRARVDSFKSNILVYVLFVVLYVLGVVFYWYFSVFFIVLYMLLLGVFFLIFYVRQFVICELVFTNRIIRFCAVVFALDILYVILLFWSLSIVILSLLIPLIILASFIIFSLVYLLFVPIEKSIGKRYIAKAKRILDTSKNLIKIGVTGSYGKTSVKEILSAILKENFNVIATPKSYNTPYGITKTINEKLTNSTEVFICEMGAKRKGEILELCNMVNCDMGIITSVGHQHTDIFGSIENVYLTKKELADFLRNKICVFNLMNDFTRKMYFNYVGKGIGCFIVSKRVAENVVKVVKKKLKNFVIKSSVGLMVLYSLPHKNNYYAKINKMTEFGSDFDIYYNYQKLGTITTLLLGRHNIINVLLAVAMAIDLKVPFSKVQKALITLRSISARLEKFVTKKGAVVINNGYNSNINSARSSLGVLNLFEKRTKVVITPGLIETSDDFTYNRLFGEMISRVADEVIVVKQKNKNAILSGLSKSCFDMSKVYFVDSFLDAKGVIDMAGEDYVFLIENDLPNYYK